MPECLKRAHNDGNEYGVPRFAISAGEPQALRGARRLDDKTLPDRLVDAPLANTGGFATQLAQVVETGTTYPTQGDHLDLVDAG